MVKKFDRYFNLCCAGKKEKSFAFFISEVAVQHNDVLSFDCGRGISSMEGGYIYGEILAFIVGILNRLILSIFLTKSFALRTDQDC